MLYILMILVFIMGYVSRLVFVQSNQYRMLKRLDEWTKENNRLGATLKPEK